MERHQTLLDRLSRDKRDDWLTMLALSERSDDGRVDVLREAIVNLLPSCRDDLLQLLFGYYMSAIYDRNVCPCLDEKGMCLPGKHVEHQDAVREGRSHQARAALELWPLLPEYEMGKIRVFDSQDSSHLEAVPQPTLPETRKAILMVIAKQWLEVKDNVESLSLFDALLDLKLCSGDGKIRADVLRAVTNDRSCSTGRLTLCIIKALESGDLDTMRGERFDLSFGIAQILNSARNRSLGRVEFKREAILDQGLLGASEAVYEATTKFARDMRRLDDQVTGLVELLWESKRSFSSILPAKPHLAYLEQGHLIQIGVLFTHNRRDSASPVEAQFAKAKEIIVAWRESQGVSAPRVILKFVGAQGYTGNQTYSHEETIG